jgi:hypothetical protein
MDNIEPGPQDTASIKIFFSMQSKPAAAAEGS